MKKRHFQTGWSLLAMASATLAYASELEKLTFQADWFANAQFAGFFWAQQDGLYAANAMEIEFAEFDFGVDFINRVSSGEAAFGTAEAYILMNAVASGHDLVALGAVLGTSPAGYMFLMESGVRSAVDLAGKRVGVHKYAEMLLPFFVAEAGLAADSVKAVEVEHKIEILLSGEVDLHQGYSIDEKLRLQAMTEKEVGMLLFEDLGLPMYSMVVYSSRAFVEANPELVTKFMEASAEGWRRAMQSPAIAALVIHSAYPSDAVPGELLARQAEAMRPFVMMDGRPVLSMQRAKWEAMQDVYLKSGMIDKPVDLDRFLYKPESVD